MLLRHVWKYSKKKYPEFVSPLTIGLGLLISLSCSCRDNDTVLKPPCVTAAATLCSRPTRRGSEVRDGAQPTTPRLPREPSSSGNGQLHCLSVTVRGCFHVLLRLSLQESVSPLAEHRGVQVAPLIVPTHSPAPFPLLQDTQYWCVCSVRLQVSFHPGMPANQLENSSIIRNAKL